MTFNLARGRSIGNFRRLLMRAVILAVLSLLSACDSQQLTQLRDGHAFSPEREGFTADKLQRLKLPAGFTIDIWARGLGHPRMIAVSASGNVYITRYNEGDVLAFKEGDRSSNARTVARIPDVHGIAIDEKTQKLYLADVRNVYISDIQPDGSLSPPRRIISTLGEGGHDRRTIGIGPDRKLYISVGSTCNVCQDDPEQYAVILRANLDGSGLAPFARGLRNTIGFDWHPQTHAMFGMDHGVDWRGDDRPREELNELVAGAHYGWPYCIENKSPDPYYRESTPGTTKEKFCSTSIAPVLLTTAHSAPIEFRFYAAAMFPPDYKGDAFVAMHGSWNRRPASGYKVLRVKVENGKPARFEDFITGFLNPAGDSVFGRPAGLAVQNDGSLLVSDDMNGVIYRVAYKK
jgi:glucose/arabinose dehydrogenase